MRSVRFLIGVPVAALVTLALFVFMRGLINEDHPPIPEDPIPDISLVLGPTITDTKTQTNEPDEVEPPEVEPINPPAPVPPDVFTDDEDTQGWGQTVETGPVGPIVIGREVCGQPIIRIAPTYPRRAVNEGIEGYAIIGFTVTEQGTIRDAHVIEDQPRGVFGSSALKAVKKWRYEPCVVNGKISEVKLQIQLVFEFGQEE